MRAICAGLLVLMGCAQWEELPEGATGFLNVEGATLTGSIGGVEVDGAADATGYCTVDGWMLDLRVRGEGGTVMSVVDIRSLFWRRESLTATFRAGAGNTMVLETTSMELDPWSRAEASAVVEGCSGDRDGDWTTEEHAEVALVDIAFPSFNQMEVTYEAQFPSGDVLIGTFQSEMPVTD